jgi:hypothetical protein
VTRRFSPTPVRRPGANGRAGLHDRSGSAAPDAAAAAGIDKLLGTGLVLEEQERAGAGYDPYDTYPNVSQPNGTQKHADLRRLSEAIRAQREAAQAARTAAGEEPAPKGLRRLLKPRR